MNNPVLDEIAGLSPEAQAALAQAHKAMAGGAGTTTAAPTPPAPMRPPRQAMPALGAPPEAPEISALGPQAPMPSLPGAPNPLPPSLTQNAPAGTTDFDKNRLAHLKDTGSGISQIHSKIENSNFGQNHPTLGKVLGWGAEIPARLGDIAASAVAPALAINMPGTEYHHRALLNQATKQLGTDEANAQHEAATAHTQAETGAIPATTAHTEAETAALKNPKVGATPEETTIHDLMTGENGAPRRNLETGKPYSYLEAYGAVAQAKQDVKPEPVAPAHVTYDAGIPVSVTGPDKKTYDVNDPKLPEELKSLVQAATRAHGQHISEEASKTAVANAETEKRFQEHQDALTNTTKTMVEAAPKVLQLVSRIKTLVDQQEKTLGPAASRWNEFMAGKVGSPNAEFTKLRTDVGLVTTLLMRMHVGARGGEYIMKHFQDLIDSSKQSPENLRAALGEIEQYANDVAAEGKGGKRPAGGAGGGQGGGAVNMKAPDGTVKPVPADQVEHYKSLGATVAQ